MYLSFGKNPTRVPNLVKYQFGYHTLIRIFLDTTLEFHFDGRAWCPSESWRQRNARCQSEAWWRSNAWWHDSGEKAKKNHILEIVSCKSKEMICPMWKYGEDDTIILFNLGLGVSINKNFSSIYAIKWGLDINVLFTCKKYFYMNQTQ